MSLHLTKVALGATSVEQLAERLHARAEQGPLVVTTRFLPKRHEEVAGQGSLYWIVRHQLVARSPILRFGEAADRRVAIHIDPALVAVRPRPKRAHQGWRYLEHGDAPDDLGGSAEGAAMLPPRLALELSALMLI